MLTPNVPISTKKKHFSKLTSDMCNLPEVKTLLPKWAICGQGASLTMYSETRAQISMQAQNVFTLVIDVVI